MENYNIERLDRPAGAHGGIATLIRILGGVTNKLQVWMSTTQSA